MATYKEQNKLNVPHLRFPEFHGEWDKCKVSDLLDFYSTNSLSWEQLEYGTDNMLKLTLWAYPCWATNYGGFVKGYFAGNKERK